MIRATEEIFVTGNESPELKAGDTITVTYKIAERAKQRTQLYHSVVIKISGHDTKRRFAAHKMSGTVGVERIFPIESPNIDSIEVNKRSKVRRSKLYHLRGLAGKRACIQKGGIVTNG